MEEPEGLLAVGERRLERRGHPHGSGEGHCLSYLAEQSFGQGTEAPAVQELSRRKGDAEHLLQPLLELDGGQRVEPLAHQR